MRAFTPLLQGCVALAVFLAASASAWAEPQGWVINSRGDFPDSSRIGALWSIDLASGEARLEGRSRIEDYIFIEGLSFGSDERLYGVDDDTNTLVRIGTTSGNAVAVNQTVRNLALPLDNHDFGLAHTCDGRVLVSTDSATLGSALYEADAETGELTRIGAIGAPVVDLATIGDQVFGIGRGMASDGNPAAPNLYRIDIETGQAELVGALGSAADLYNKAGLASDADGRLWAVTERRNPAAPDRSIASQVLLIDSDTGRAQRVAETIVHDSREALVGIESLAIAPPGDCDRGAAPVEPELVPLLSPAGRWLLLLLVVGLAASQLRRAPAN